MKKSLILTGLFIGLLTGCAPSVTPSPPPAGPPAPTARPVAHAQATASAVSSSPPAATLSPPNDLTFSPIAPLAEPIAPLTRSFVKVTLPGVKRGVTALDGRGPNDLWILTQEEMTDRIGVTVGGEVFQYDGSKVKAYGHACAFSVFGNVMVSQDAVVVLGFRPWSRGVYTSFRAALLPSGIWNCDDDNGGYWMGLTSTTGDHVWELSWQGRSGSLRASGGPEVRLPVEDPSSDEHGEDRPLLIQGISMRGTDNGYMVRKGGDGRPWFYRFNGVAWAPLAPLDKHMAVADMFTAGADDVWIAIRWNGQEEGPANDLLHWDGKTLALVAVPAAFAVRQVGADSPDNVWFGGEGSTLYQWDGKILRRGSAPFAVGDMWVGKGEIWLAPALSDDGSPIGLVAKATPLKGATP
ncbi:MAG: hypothetical protein IPK82_31680 [Polyangiaceae bacterium]|nr:hypothetical protein [Polyangiaceae bacterium]